MPVQLRSSTKLSGNNTNMETSSEYSNQETNNNTKKTTAPQPESRMTYVVFFGLIIDLLAFTLILPLLPQLLEHYKKHDVEGGLYSYLDTNVRWFGSWLGAPNEFIPVLFGGLIGSLFSFLQFVASPMIGGLSDYYGRRPLLLLTSIGIAISYAVWCQASTFALFVLARVIGGLAKGNVTLSTAIITDISTPKTRNRGMALIGIAFSVGFLLGPMIGAGFSVWAKNRGSDQTSVEMWFIYPAVVALTLSLIEVAYLYLFFKETLVPEKRLKDLKSAFKQAFAYINPVSLFSFSTLKDSAGVNEAELSSLTTLGRLYFIYLFLYSGLEFTLTFLTHLRFNFTSMEQGKMFLFIGTLMSLVQGGYVRRIAPGSEKKMAMYGLLLIIPAYALIGFAGDLITLYSGLALYALSTSVVVPCLTTLVSKYGDVSQKGIVMGVYRSLGALGRALGPIFASTVYWMVGPEMCYSIGGLGLIIPYLMLKRCSIS